MSPIDREAIAYSSIELSLSTIIGEISSSKSALALPAYAKESPMRIPILCFSVVADSSLSERMAYAASASFLIPLLTIPRAM
jgi:hypothetical protein